MVVVWVVALQEDVEDGIFEVLDFSNSAGVRAESRRHTNSNRAGYSLVHFLEAREAQPTNHRSLSHLVANHMTITSIPSLSFYKDHYAYFDAPVKRLSRRRGRVTR